MLWVICGLIGLIVGIIISVHGHLMDAGVLVTFLFILISILLGFLISIPIAESSETVIASQEEYDLCPMIDNTIYVMRNNDSYEFLLKQEDGTYVPQKCAESSFKVGYIENPNHAKVRITKYEYGKVGKFLIGHFNLVDEYFFILPMGSQPISFGG